MLNSSEGAGLVDLFDQADRRVRRVGATLSLMQSAANDQQLGEEWGAALELLRCELLGAQQLQGEIKGALFGTPMRKA